MARSAVIVAVAVTLLAGCSGGADRANHIRPANHQALQSLPPGFTAPGGNEPLASPAQLEVSPATRIDIVALQRAPFPLSLVPEAVQSVVNQPVRAVVRPILVSKVQLHPSESLTVVAAGLGTGPSHDALLVLQGPGYRGERLVQVRFGAAAAVVTLPPALRPGTWALAMVDLSGVQPQVHHQVSGQVTVDIGLFSVPG